jgi:hypothetical protein
MSPLIPGIGKPEPVNDIVQTLFQHDKQIRTGNAFSLVCPFEKQPKLPFGKAVHSFYLLLLPKLNTVVRILASASLSVFSGRVGPSIECAFV